MTVRHYLMDMRGMFAFLALLVLASHAARAQDAAGDAFMTGAEAISDSEYDALPKLEKFRAFLPKRVDLTGKFPQPGSQGRQPNCVAWATTYAARSFLYGEDIGRQPTSPELQMSPAYVYNRLRKPGSLCDKAIRIVDALKFLEREGSVTLSDFPDDIMKCPIPAPEGLRAAASQHRLAGWRAVARDRKGLAGTGSVVLDDIKGSLYRGEPVVFAMPAMADFKALRGDAVYRRTEPATTNLHAMTVIGYDEDRQAFRVLNSWGSYWGDKGYAWVDYQTFRLLATEAYALQGGPTRQLTTPEAPPSTRAALEVLAARLPCGAVQIATTPQGLVLNGFGGDQAALSRLRSAAAAIDPQLVWRVQHHPWPQCEAELTLTGALAVGGVSVIAQSPGGRPRKGDPVTMRQGEFFGISADVEANRPYLALIYLQADGSAVPLFQGKAQVAHAGQHSLTLGLSEAADRFRVSPPLGDEVIIALASDRPLFGTDTTGYATEREFLTVLRGKLAGLPAGALGAAVLRIRTRP